VLALVDTDCTGVDVLPRWAIFEKLGRGYSPSAISVFSAKTSADHYFALGGSVQGKIISASVCTDRFYPTFCFVKPYVG
jgi:hypothetical protein